MSAQRKTRVSGFAAMAQNLSKLAKIVPATRKCALSERKGTCAV